MDEADPNAGAAGASSDGPVVLVTGATGFVGSRLVSALADRGHRVRALTRRAAGLEALVRPGVEVVRGDLGDPTALVRAAEGTRLVFHAAEHASRHAGQIATTRKVVRG
mgnify:CR=1 FL=1